MKRKDRSKFFWISYSDLMTSLFFVMLVLFAITMVKYVTADPERLVNENERLKTQTENLKKQVDTLNSRNAMLTDSLGKAVITIAQQREYIDIVRQFKPLKESGKFVYLPESSKYVAKDFLGIEIFDPDQGVILPQYRKQTIEIGNEIVKVLKSLKESNPEYSYVLVIEGNTANDPGHPYSKDAPGSYKLSYERALAVYTLWRNSGINLRQYNTEVLLSGSGMNGWDRDPEERNNKRFSIQIIPRIKSPDDFIE